MSRHPREDEDRALVWIIVVVALLAACIGFAVWFFGGLGGSTQQYPSEAAGGTAAPSMSKDGKY